jgi:cytochrome bd-type quinol oxidase subunit 2
MIQEYTFKGRITTLLSVRIHGIILLIFYILYAIVIYKLVELYLSSFENFLNARGALLMIMVSLPFLLLFFILSYNIYKYQVFNEKIIHGKFESDKIIWNDSKNEKQISKDQLFKSTFFFLLIDFLGKQFV